MVVTKSLHWLEKNGRQPFFLFLHTYEVHLPHTHGEVQQTGLNTDEPVRQKALKGYDADLRFADRILTRLWERLRTRGIYQDSIIVVLSDHGEALHERTLFGRGDDHGYHLHDELLRVPLAIVAPGRIERGVWLTDPVQLVDVLPTIVDMAGLERPATPLQGASLVPLIRGERLPMRPLFAEAPYQGPGWIAVRFDRFKYLAVPSKHVHEGPEMWWDRDRGAVPEALYDLRSDPGETNNVASRNPDQLARLRRYAENMRQSSEQISMLTRPERQQQKAVDPELLKRLRSLGYLQ
jgi:arylsulfatase A-like enzyme